MLLKGKSTSVLTLLERRMLKLLFTGIFHALSLNVCDLSGENRYDTHDC